MTKGCHSFTCTENKSYFKLMNLTDVFFYAQKVIERERERERERENNDLDFVIHSLLEELA